MTRIADMPVGTSAVLNIDRDGKKMDFKLVVEDRMKVFADDERVMGKLDQPVPEASKAEVSRVVQFGVGLRPLTDDEKGLTSDKRGLYVARVEPGSFASDIGLMERDIITSLNRQPVNSLEDVKKVQATLKPGDPVAFHVIRSAGLVHTRAATTPAASLWLSGTLPE
jgi:serine protease Do